MKINIITVISTITALLAAAAVPNVFIHSSSIEQKLDGVLKLKIDEDLAGGRVLSSHYDRGGDDSGPGCFSYPLAESYTEGVLDIIKYTVREPVRNQRGGDYWQCDILMGNVSPDINYPFGCVRISLYIDLNGTVSGSEKGLKGDDDAVFDPSHPWDIGLIINGYESEAEVFFADGAPPAKARILFLPKQKSILVRFPLENPEISGILSKNDSWHYLFTKGYERLLPGNVLPVRKTASFRSGGGNDGCSSEIYDILMPAGIEITDNDSFGTMIPVQSSFRGAAVSADLEQLAEKSRRWLADKEDKGNTELTAETGSLQQGIDLFYSGDLGGAENIFKKYENSIEGLAYLGAVTASKAATAENVMDAVDYVNRGYEMMDRAYESASNDIEFITVRMCRANVSMNVPEEVFHKSLQGAHDFEEAAQLFTETGISDSESISDIYVRAAVCADRGGDSVYCESLLIKAGSIGFTPFGRYEAAKRGIHIE